MGPCPACSVKLIDGKPLWNIDLIVTAKEFTWLGDLLSSGVVPLIQIVCNNCGYVMLFNAIRFGLVDPQTRQYRMPPPPRVPWGSARVEAAVEAKEKKETGPGSGEGG
jgi:hypothetical protein